MYNTTKAHSIACNTLNIKKTHRTPPVHVQALINKRTSDQTEQKEDKGTRTNTNSTTKNNDSYMIRFVKVEKKKS